MQTWTSDECVRDDDVAGRWYGISAGIPSLDEVVNEANGMGDVMEDVEIFFLANTYTSTGATAPRRALRQQPGVVSARSRCNTLSLGSKLIISSLYTA